MRPIDIGPADLETVRRILYEHTSGLEVRAFGSRVSWTARETSDLDLTLMTAEPLNIARMAELKATFTESDLPFRVDIVDWASTSESFRKVIEREYVVLAEKKERRVGDDWRECIIADACSSIDYGLTASASSSKTEPHFLRITDIVSGHIDWKRVPHVVVDNDIVSKYRLYDGDIVIARTGASTGASMYVKNPPLALFASYLVRLQAKPDFDPRFLAYFLKSKEFWEFIRGVLGDKSAQPNASASTMTTAPLRVPKNKGEQRAIAHILGTLDDKIELNRRMNETLEAMARALFKSWFVDFDPVRAKAALKRHATLDRESAKARPADAAPSDITPPLRGSRQDKGVSQRASRGGGDEWTLERARAYLDGMGEEVTALFPDSFVDSELGEIPEGWRVGCLADIAVSPRRGIDPTNLRDETSYIGLEHMPRHSITLTEWGDTEKVTSNKSIFEKGEILFGKLRPYFHKVGIAPVSGVCSTDIVVIAPTTAEWSAFLLACVSSTEFVAYTDQTSTGTKMPRTSWDTMSRYPLCLPTESVARVFQNAVWPTLDRIVANIHESRTLAALRDALLPKLISGETRVREMT